MHLVVPERPSHPVAQGLPLADLLLEDFLADEGEVAVSLAWVYGLEQGMGVHYVLELYVGYLLLTYPQR